MLPLELEHTFCRWTDDMNEALIIFSRESI